MTTTNVYTRQPAKMDYASPIQFRFKCTKLPNVEFFCQSANLPGISLGSAQQATPLYDIPIPGDKITYQDLSITFLVDENLNNYKEIHDWLLGLGFPNKHQQFADLQATAQDRFPGSTAGASVPGVATPKPLAEGGIYSDATLTILNSKNIAKTEIRFQNLYPTSLGSLSYDVKLSDVDYLQASISFTYMNYDIIQISTT
ncbi:MAG: hypothetical protein H8D92_01760 [Pelagibacteraceae bacterium]|nr:hypothetical protein [Pelagibacteraceae bacterium]